MLAGVVLAATAVAWLLWRLDAGPLPLPALDRPLAGAVAALAPDLDVRVGASALVRAGRGLALEVADVRIAGRDGAAILAVPHVRVRPSLGALVRGRFVVARVDVADVAVPLTREADGGWTLGAGAGVALAAGEGGGSTRAVPLPRIAFTRSRVSIDDHRSGGTIAVSDADLVISPGDAGVTAMLTAVLDMESDVPPIRGRFHLPIRAELAADVLGDGTPGDVRFAVAGGEGTLAPAGDTEPPLVLTGLAANGRYRPVRETLTLDRVVATIGTSRLDARAAVRMGIAPTLALDGTVDTLTLGGLARLWPVDLASAARTWVATSLRAGELHRCRVLLGDALPPPDAADDAANAGPGTDGGSRPPRDVAASRAARADAALSTHSGERGRPPRAAAATPAPGRTPSAATANTARPQPAAAGAALAVDVACDFSGVAAEYLPPLDPIRAASGSARLTAERLVVDVRSGAVGACRVDGGTFAMDLTVDPARAAIAADVSGTTADVLALVEKPPIAFTPPLGIVRSTVGGTSRVHAELQLPIATTLAPSEIAVQATATLVDASLPPLAAGIGLRDGRLDVRVDGTTRVEIQGTAAVTGTSLVTKPVTLALAVEAAGAAGERAVTLTVDGDDVKGRGSARVTSGGLAALTIDRLQLAGSDVAATLRRAGPDGFTASLSGAALDVERLLGGEPVYGDDLRMVAPFMLAVDVASVRTATALELRNVRGTIAGRDGRVTAVDVAAGLVPSGTLSVTLEDGDGPRRFAVATDRAGQVLAALGGLQQFVGGSLALEATTDARGPLAALDGKLVLRDVRIVRAPVLAKVLALGSLGGIGALVQGEGLPISKARLPFAWDGNVLTVRDARAVGAIGLTADGTFDRAAGTCDVRGNVIPAYSLNSALGKLPVLGRFLVGSKGDGVFGIDYRVTGKTADPTVRVNPLTSVAPTVLRAWFVDPFTRAADGAGPSPARPPR